MPVNIQQNNDELENIRVARVTVNTTSTATAGLVWQNPENRAVLANLTIRWVTAGTGTIDVGIGTAGTGAGSALIDGGTMTGVVTANRTAATAGGTAWYRLAASGNGGDSIVGQMSDTETSTAVGTAYIMFFFA